MINLRPIPTKVERDEFMQLACELFEKYGLENRMTFFISNHAATEFMIRVEVDPPINWIDEKISILEIVTSRQKRAQLIVDAIERLVKRARNIRNEIAEREFRGLESVLRDD